MRFQLDVTLTEKDYLAFNIFHTLELSHGKKQIRNARILYIAIIVLGMACSVLVRGWTLRTIIFIILLARFSVPPMIFFRKIFIQNIKSQIKQMKKREKLPFDPIAKLEFYEDKLVEITAGTRTEQRYNVLERICVVKDRFVLLYSSSIGAHILPMLQIKAQLGQEDFLAFLSQKCNNIEYY